MSNDYDSTPDNFDQLVVELANVVRNLGLLIQSINGFFPRIFGTFTMPAAASFVVTTTAVQANSFVSLNPTNAAAATLQAGANRIWVSAISAGASFTVSTTGGGAAAGTETFGYTIATPA